MEELQLLPKFFDGYKVLICKKMRYYNTASAEKIASSAKIIGTCGKNLTFRPILFDGQNITITIIKGKNKASTYFIIKLYSMIVGYVPIILLPIDTNVTYLFPKCECVYYRQTDKRVTIKMKVHKIKTSNLMTTLVSAGGINNI